MAKRQPNNSKATVLASASAAPTVDGLAATLAKLEADAAKTDKQRDTAKVRVAKQRETRHARLIQLRDEGTAKAPANPQIRPDTLRATEPGELIGGKPAKGWAVEIECAGCGKPRLVNTQDAFQARYHTACKPKGSSKSKQAQRAREIADTMDADAIQARIAELEEAVAKAS